MTRTARFFALLGFACLIGTATAADPPRHATLDDLYADERLPDAAVSPSGRYIAAVLRLPDISVVLVMDRQTGENKPIVRLGKDNVMPGTEGFITAVYWKSEDRLVFRTRVWPKEDARVSNFSERKIYSLGDRLHAVDRDGGRLVRLLADNRNLALDGALNLGSIASFLPAEPDYIMMVVDGFDGRSLFRVNIVSGMGEIIERPSGSVIAWWLDVNGTPIVRMEYWAATWRFLRKDAAGKWKVFYKIRARELEERPDYEAVGPSSEPGKYYVLARPAGRDRIGLYKYDLTSESFGEPVVEHPTYDLLSAQISRDGKRVQRYCYVAHVRTCEFSDARINGHMKGLHRYFEQSANIFVYDTSEDENVLLLYVEGPGTPPSFHRYLVKDRAIEAIGTVRPGMDKLARPAAAVVNWTAGDGLALSGYLTRPPGAGTARSLPLIVYPHGGPELRDWLTFDPWVQYFTARGYAVFQPNFRGSSGFGDAFARKGYGEWGRKMQDDITDGVKKLIAEGSIDPARVCIVGASYGGYAALAGLALTPDLYRCGVSVAGISDLVDFIAFRKRRWGADSDGYTYWLEAIGDPEKVGPQLEATSPVRLAASIRAPLLLIHGTEDGIVPLDQSVDMKKALDKRGRPTELLKLKDEGHSGWSDRNEKQALAAIDRFLWQHLGPGHGAPSPPPAAPVTAR